MPALADSVPARAVVVNGLAGAALYGTFSYVALVAASARRRSAPGCCSSR
ncbi:hypothetical protein AB0F15_18450 [Amycolatopsis sp. NPDC026612]